MAFAHNVRLKRDVAKDTSVTFTDVELVNDLDVVRLREEMENSGRVPARAAA